MASLFGRENLDDLAVFHLIVDRHDALVDFGPHHAVTNRAVDGIGKVDHGRTARQADHVALWGKYKHLFRRKV